MISLEENLLTYDTLKKGELTVSPNPSKDFFTVKYFIDKMYREASLFLLDNKGAIVKSMPLVFEQDELIVGTSSFSKGNYTLILKIDGTPYLSQTIIIQ